MRNLSQNQDLGLSALENETRAISKLRFTLLKIEMSKLRLES